MQVEVLDETYFDVNRYRLHTATSFELCLVSHDIVRIRTGENYALKWITKPYSYKLFIVQSYSDSAPL
jgi:hypothetical protein